jgi:hypothetical protein
MSDTAVDELARILPRKKRSGECAPLNMAKGEPVPQENGGPAEQQPSAEQNEQQDSSRLAVEALNTSMNDSPVDVENFIASATSLAMDETEDLMLRIAASTLSKGPMTIEDLSKAMNVPSDDGFAAFLRQIADERAGQYHLKNGATHELVSMMLSGFGTDEAYQERERTRESDTEQHGQTFLQHTDVRQGPELREDERSGPATSCPRFARGQKVFCARDRSTSTSADESSQGEGMFCVIVGDPRAKATGTFYLVDDEEHRSSDVRELNEVSQSRLHHIADHNCSLDHLTEGTAVIAPHPDTKKFHKANVARDWKGNDASKPEQVWVTFDGEEEQCSEWVERRFVFVESQIQ